MPDTSKRDAEGVFSVAFMLLMNFAGWWVGTFAVLFFAEMFIYEKVNGHGLPIDPSNGAAQESVYPYFVLPAIVATVLFAVRVPAVIREYWGTTPSPSKPKDRTRPTGRRDRTTRPITPTKPKPKPKHVLRTEPDPGWVERRYDKAEAQERCPTPNKAKEKSEKYGVLQRAYSCDCGYWHLTTMSEINVGRNDNDDVGREHSRAIGSEVAARLRMPGVKAPWVALVLVPLWIIVSLAFIAITEQNRGEPALPVDIFIAWLGGAICVWMVVGVPLLIWLDRKRRKKEGTVKVPWEAPKTDKQVRVHTQRGYWAKRGGKYQHNIDKYEQMIMAPLTKAERRQFRPASAWLVAWLPLGFAGLAVGMLIAESVADNTFVRFFTGTIGIAVLIAAWILPGIRVRRINSEAVKTIRDAREDAFEEWRRSRQRKARNDYSDDDYGDGTGRTYPVTDGVYNPELYYERGGYSTYQALDRWNVDYDTYKSNIE